MKDKVCLVTGASSGIGVGVALAFAKKGCAGIALVARYHLYGSTLAHPSRLDPVKFLFGSSLSSRRKEKLEDVAKQCKSAGVKDVLVLSKDLSDLKACAEAVKETADHFGSKYLHSCATMNTQVILQKTHDVSHIMLHFVRKTRA